MCRLRSRASARSGDRNPRFAFSALLRLSQADQGPGYERSYETRGDTVAACVHGPIINACVRESCVSQSIVLIKLVTARIPIKHFLYETCFSRVHSSSGFSQMLLKTTHSSQDISFMKRYRSPWRWQQPRTLASICFRPVVRSRVGSRRSVAADALVIVALRI